MKLFGSIISAIIILTINTMFVCSPSPAMGDCTDILKQARKIEEDINKRLPSGEIQIKQYKKILRLTQQCPESQDPPHVRFEINVLKIAAQLRIKELSTPREPTCQSCATLPSPCPLCACWEDIYHDCYSRYAHPLDLIGQIPCKEASELIHSYYNDAWSLLKKDDFQRQVDYPQETISKLWRLLYRLSKKECINKEFVKKAIQRVFYPQPPETEACGRALPIDPETQIRFVQAMTQLSPEKRLELIKSFIQITEAGEKEKKRFQYLLLKLSTMEQSNLESAISMLAKVPWVQMDAADLKQYSHTPMGEAASLLVYDIKIIGSDYPAPNDWQAARRINDAFQSPRVVPEGYRIVPGGPQPFDFSIIQNGRIGQPIKSYPASHRDSSVHLALFGALEPGGSEEDNILYLSFINSNGLLLFNDIVKISPLTLRDPNQLHSRLKSVFERFQLFISIMRIMDKREASASVAYVQGEKPAAFLQRAIAAQAQFHSLYGQPDSEIWRRVDDIVIPDEFWLKTRQTDTKRDSGTNTADYEIDMRAKNYLGVGFKGAITERLFALYFRSYSNLISRSKDRPATSLIINGEYIGPELDQAYRSSSSEAVTLRIIFSINYEIKATTDLSLPVAWIKNKDQVKQIVTQTVCGAVATLLTFDPEPIHPPPVCDDACCENCVLHPEYPAMASFFMPGIWRKEAGGNKQPSLLLKTWNYSNAGLFTVSLGSAALYVNNDYEDDGLFWTAVGGTGLFVVNGAIGWIDALLNGNKQSAHTNQARTKIGLQATPLGDTPAFVVSMPY